jgi:hypothetical protein
VKSDSLSTPWLPRAKKLLQGQKLVFFSFVSSERTQELMSICSSKEAGATNPRGIPYAPFVDKVEDYVTSREEVEGTLRQFQEMISKYQFMELNLQRRVAGLGDKMPDIQKTLDTVRFLKTRTVCLKMLVDDDEATRAAKQ